MGGGASMQKKTRDHPRSSTSSDSSACSQSKLRAKARRAKETPKKTSLDQPFSMGKLERGKFRSDSSLKNLKFGSS